MGQRNIKSIGYGEIEDFLHDQKVSDKTKANIKSCLHSFFVWVNKREKIPMPAFPEISFELGWRQIVDKETQQAIIDEVYRISSNINPKIWLGIKWLSTYISVRPTELINIKEKEISIETGYLLIPHPKEKKAKAVPLIQEDIDILASFPKALPKLYFFRHPAGISGCRAGEQFGKRYLYKWWKKACSNLGIDGVDLYGGTRHSSAMALRQLASPEQIKRSMMTSTNKAFERYFRIESEEVRDVYQLTRKGIRVGYQKEASKNDNSLNILNINGGGGGSRIRLTAFSANSGMSGFPLNFKPVRAFLAIFNKQNKFNNPIQNKNFLHQIYPKDKIKNNLK
ncbi:MAG: hypothetical protein KAT52_05060 [Desulfobacterales bacterium]|nr:hypothetical protein [Desulfobacterales bacterium]